MHARFPKILYLLLAVTALGVPALFGMGLLVTRLLGLNVPILYLALGALSLTLVADVSIAIANERLNARADAKTHELNEPVGEQAAVVDAFTSSGEATEGRVTVHGQTWSARCEEGILFEVGQEVHVTDRRGLTVLVRPTSP